jgi:hypothetical protein
MIDAHFVSRPFFRIEVVGTMRNVRPVSDPYRDVENCPMYPLFGQFASRILPALSQRSTRILISFSTSL